MGKKIGVAGVGRLGREHVRVLCSLDDVEVVGCYDTIPERARSAAAEHGAHVHESLEALFVAMDAVVISVPTTAHAQVATQALDAGCDIFVEKPLAANIPDAERIISMARERSAVLQVGHVERFNGIVQAVANEVREPQFIEISRLAPFSVRGTDVSVVGDLMIHDLDLLTFFLRCSPSEIHAKGAAVITAGPDIVNARLAYPDGCVANVTASRVTVQPTRKWRIFSPNGYLSIDLRAGKAVRYRKSSSFDDNVAAIKSQKSGHEKLALTDFIEIETITSDGAEPLQKELSCFRDAVVSREPAPVTGEDGLAAMRLAAAVLACLDGA